MRTRLAKITLSLSCTLLGGAAALRAQAPHPAANSNLADYSAVNCSGFVSDQKVSDEIRLISGEQSNYKITFARGDYVYINRGQDKGVRVGDRFTVVRPEKDPDPVVWFKWQSKLMKAMGTNYLDAGQLKVVNVLPKTSIAEVTFSCGYMQRGDILQPFQERQAPAYKDPTTFDHFAPVSGKPVAMVVAGTDYTDSLGKNNVAFVNLGTSQGVKPGDYFRVFRYQGTTAETSVNTPGYQYKMFGFGSTPERYTWNDLPREIIGEGMVLNTSRNSSTMLVTYSSSAIFAGDYVEIE